MKNDKELPTTKTSLSTSERNKALQEQIRSSLKATRKYEGYMDYPPVYISDFFDPKTGTLDQQKFDQLSALVNRAHAHNKEIDAAKQESQESKSLTPLEERLGSPCHKPAEKSSPSSSPKSRDSSDSNSLTAFKLVDLERSRSSSSNSSDSSRSRH